MKLIKIISLITFVSLVITSIIWGYIAYLSITTELANFAIVVTVLFVLGSIVQLIVALNED
jgi:hypothetical protein